MISIVSSLQKFSIYPESGAVFDCVMEYYGPGLFTVEEFLDAAIHNYLIEGEDGVTKKLSYLSITNRTGSSKTVKFLKKAAASHYQLTPAFAIPDGNTLSWTALNGFQLLDPTL